MGNFKKTDNANVEAKLDVRRYFLSKYHADEPLSVMDCCQGDAVLWTTLRKEYEVETYWGVDLKPKKGRLKLDSSRILSQPGWEQNVLDIDVYGSPWRHWFNLLPNISRPTTVFLTVGQVQMGTSKEILEALGIPRRWKIPPSIGLKLHDLANRYLFARALEEGLEIEELAQSTKKGKSANYYGIRISPVYARNDEGAFLFDDEGKKIPIGKVVWA